MHTHTAYPKKFSEFVFRLYTLQTVPELVNTVCHGLLDLIAGENVAVARCHANTRSLSAMCALHPFAHKNFLPDIVRGELLASHPFWDHALKPDLPVKSVSDFLTARKWKTHPYFNEFIKEDGFQDHMEIEIGVRGSTYTSIDVLRARHGFSDAERTILLMLKPHLEQAFLNARMAEQFTLGLGSEEPGAVSMLRITHDGELEDMPAGSSRDNLIPKVVRDWVKEQVGWLNRGMLDPTIQPFAWKHAGRCTEFRLHRQWGEAGYLLSFRLVHASNASRKPLTSREQDVMRWVGEGKTNEEIAIILGISPHTVKDHLKSIYRKLGVDNRTAAARVWHERQTAQTNLTPSPPTPA